VKRRKRRVPAVHDITEPEPDDLPPSSDDYAALSADISSSSSSDEDSSESACWPQVGRMEMLSDQGSGFVSFVVPSSEPLGGGSSMDSEDAPTEVQPVSFTIQSGCCNIDGVDSQSSVNDMTDATQPSDDGSQTLEAASPTVVDSEQNFLVVECAVNLDFSGKLVQSRTLVVDAPASSQSWVPVSSSVTSHLHDVFVMTQQASDNALSSVSSTEAKCVLCSQHGEFNTEADQFATISDVKSSQDTVEQCTQRDSFSAVCSPDRFDEVIDERIECEISNAAKDSRQSGIESLHAVGIENVLVDEVIQATNETDVKEEDFVPTDDHNLLDNEQLSTASVGCYGGCKTQDDIDFHSPVLRPRSRSISQCQSGSVQLTSYERATSLSLSQLHLQSRDGDSDAYSSLLENQQESRINHSNFITLTDLPRLWPVSTEALPPVQKPLESTPWQRQNRSGNTDLDQTGNVPLNPVTTGSSASYENVHGIDVVVFSGASEPGCEVCASPDCSQCETCTPSSAEHLPVESCPDQKIQPYTTVLQEDNNSEQLSLPGSASHSYTAGVNPAFCGLDLKSEFEMEENSTAPGWQSHDQLTQEASAHHCNSDIINRDQESYKAELPSDGKVTEDSSLAASIADAAGTRCDRIQTKVEETSPTKMRQGEVVKSGEQEVIPAGNFSASEFLPQTQVADHYQEDLKPITLSQCEEFAVEFQVGGLSDGSTTDDELLKFSQSDNTACDGHGTSMVILSTVYERIHSNVFTDTLDADSFMTLSGDGDMTQQLNPQTSGIAESCQCSVRLDKVQQDQLTSAVNDPLLAVVGRADGLLSGDSQEDLGGTDVDVLVVANNVDDGTMAIAAIAGDIAVSAVADTTVAPVSEKADLGSNSHIFDEAQVKRANSWQTPRNDSDLAVVRIQVDNGANAEYAGCIALSVVVLGESVVAETLIAPEPQTAVELTSGSEVDRFSGTDVVANSEAEEQVLPIDDQPIDTISAVVMTDTCDVDRVAVNVTEKTTALLNASADASSIYHAVLEGKTHDIESAVTVSASDASDQVARSLSADGSTEIKGYRSADGLNAASSDVSFIDTNTVLLKQPNSDVGHVGMSSNTDRCLLDCVSGLSLLKSEEGADIMSSSSEKSTVDGVGDSGEEQGEHLSAIISGVRASAERSATGGIYVSSICRKEAAESTVIAGNVTSTVTVAESRLSTVDDAVNDENWHSSISQHVQEGNGNVVVPKQAEITELPCRPESVEDTHRVTVTSEAHDYSAFEGSACDENTDCTDIDNDTEKMTVAENSQKCLGKKHKDTSVSFILSLPEKHLGVDPESQNVVAGDQVATDACSCKVVEKSSNIATEEVNELRRKPFHLDDTAIIHEAGAVQCASKETLSVAINASNGIEFVSDDFEACSAFQGRNAVPDSCSAVYSPADITSEVQIVSQPATLSHESCELSLSALEFANVLHRRYDDEAFFEGDEAGSVDLNSVANCQCIAALDRNDCKIIDEVAMMDNSESWRRNVTAGRTAVSESCASLQAAITCTDSRSFVSGTADTAVIPDSAKNTFDITADAGHCTAPDDKVTGVGQQLQSFRDVELCQLTPVVVFSAVADFADIGCSIRETPLLSVVEASVHLSRADETIQTYQLPASTCLDSGISSQWLEIVTSAGNCQVDESELSAAFFCYQPALLSPAEHQTTVLVSAPLQTEIQLFENTNSLLEQLLNVTCCDDIVVTNQQPFCDENGRFCQEIPKILSQLEDREVNSDSEQMAGQTCDCMTVDHVNRTATFGTATEAVSSSSAILQAGQADQINETAHSVMDEESSGGLTTVLQNQDGNKACDEITKENSIVQEWPLMLQSSAITGPSEQETMSVEFTNTKPCLCDTALLYIPEDTVTSMSESNAKQHCGLEETTDDVQLRQVNGVRHTIVQAAVDTEMVTDNQSSCVEHALRGPTVSPDASDNDKGVSYLQQLVNIIATPALDTFEGILSTDVTVKDQQIVDGHIISRMMDETVAVIRSQLDLPENNAECNIDGQRVIIIEGDDEGVLLTARNSLEHNLPAEVSCSVQVLNADKYSLRTSTSSSDQADTTTASSHHINDASLVPEGNNISVVSAVDLGAVQADASKKNRDSAFSEGVTDVRFYQPSDLPEILNGGSSVVVDGTGEVDGIADDLMAQVPSLQHGVTVTWQQCCSELLHLANWQDEDTGIPTDQMHLHSRGCSADTADREVSGIFEDNNENSGAADACRVSVNNERTVLSDPLLGGDCYPTVNDSLQNVINNCAERLATATDTFRSASYDSANVNAAEETPKIKGTGHSELRNVAFAGLTVCNMSETGMASLGTDDHGTMYGSTSDWDESLNPPASSAETPANVDVRVFADCEQMAANNQEIPVLNVESTYTSHDQLITAHQLDDSEYCSERTSSQRQPQLAISHPSRTESVRSDSMQKSSDAAGLSHPTRRALQSAAYADSLAVQVKSVDGKVQRTRSSNVKKTKLTDTEVLGIDVEPEKQHDVVESPSLQYPRVEIITSGHSAMGLGQRTDFEYHSIGLQPVGTQQPKFTPGPEQVLRDDVAEPYPASFCHSALDIEIRPQHVQKTWEPIRCDAEIDAHPYDATYVTGTAAEQSQDGLAAYGVYDKTNTDFCSQAKDSVVVVTEQIRNEDPLRGEGETTDREPVGQQTTVGAGSSVFSDSLVDMLQGLSNGMVDCVTVNHDAPGSRIARQFPSSWRLAGRSQIYNVGLDLFRSKSVERVESADVQSDGRRVRSHSDLSFISARRNCYRRSQKRRPAEPTSANSSLSKSDQELLGSTSALFEDLLPNFKDLPDRSSLDGSDSETDERSRLIGGESERFEENFLLPPQYCDLPSVSGSDADSMRTVHSGGDPAVRIAGKIQCNNVGMQNDLSVLPVSRRTFETYPCQRTTVDKCRNHGNTPNRATNENAMDRTQSMDSITYVFVGHGASSLEAVGDRRPGMVRFSSEPSSCLCEDAGLFRPVDPHTCGVLTESSSDSCLLSVDADCQTLPDRSLSCAGLHDDQNANRDGFPGGFTSEVWTGYRQLPCTALYQSDFEHADAGAWMPDSVRRSKEKASLATSVYSESAVETSDSFDGTHAKQPLSTFSSVRKSPAETQTSENHRQLLNNAGVINSLTSRTDGPCKHFVYGDRLETAASLGSSQMVQLDRVDLSVSTAAQYNMTDTHLSKEQSIVGACGRMPQICDDIDSRRSITISHTVENWLRDDIPARTASTHSLPYMMQQRDGHMSRSSSTGRTIETQTYPQMRVIETQTASDRKTCGTQTLYSSDVESGDQITAWMSIPLTASSLTSNQELDTSAVEGTRIELLPLSTCANVPVTTVGVEPVSPPAVVGSLQLSFTAGESPVTAMDDSASRQQPSITVSTDSDVADECSGRPCERYSDATLRTNRHTLSQFAGPLHQIDTQTARAASAPSLHLPMSWERFPSHGSDLEVGCQRPVYTIYNDSTSVDNAFFASTNLTSDIRTTQAAFNSARLLVVNTTDRNLQRSATPPGGSAELLLSSRHDHTTHFPRVAHSESSQSDSSTASSTLPPSSGSEHEAIISQDSMRRRTPEEGEESYKAVADKILEKYKMKRTGAVEREDERRSPHLRYDNHAHLPQCARHSHQESSSYSQEANDSGIVDSRHHLSPLTRTLLGCSSMNCDKSTSRGTGGWYDELDRLRRERRQILDMLTREVIPSRIQVQLTEAHLNYLIGQTDSLLQLAESNDGDSAAVTRDVLEADFHAFCRARLEALQRHTEAQIQRMERLGNETPRVAAGSSNFYGQSDAVADVRENMTSERRSTAEQPVCHLCSCTCSPSEREQFLLGIRREIVSATASQPVPAIHSSTGRLHTGSLRHVRPHRGHSFAHSSYPNLGPNDQPEWCRSSLPVTPASSLQHLDPRSRRRYNIFASSSSSVDGEIDTLLAECREARQRARVEIGRALDAIQRTSPSCSSLSLSSRRYFATLT